MSPGDATAPDADDRPYRSNVGIALFNVQGAVLIARRIGDDGPEIVLPGHEWQMPQGGVDRSEDQEAAARRELWEETGVTSVEILGKASRTLSYEFPAASVPGHKLSSFRGQRQLWFAMRFHGAESEIDISSPDGEQPEFSAWRWERLDRVASLVVPFKRHIYEAVAEEFRGFALPV